MTQAVALAQQASTGVSQGFKNRIINGAMVIDQRNAGASVTVTGSGQYPVDRFLCAKDTSGATVTAQQSSVVPAGFRNSLLWTTSTGASPASGDDNILRQFIEGFNFADLGFGTASAQAFTLSFWVRSSITGNYGVGFANSAANRAYMGSYTVSSANTWEQKTITIPGDTSGTWETTNGIGLRIFWDMGTGSSRSIAASSAWGSSYGVGLTGGVKLVQTTGATFYITGVQLEVGSSATSFETRSYGTEDFLCKRYYYLHASGATVPVGNFEWISSSDLRSVIHLPVTMRANPSVVSTSGSNFYRGYDGASIYFTSFLQDIVSRTTVAVTGNNSASGATQGRGGVILTDSASASLAFNAEL